MHPDVLDQLADAVLAAEHLGEVADHLIGHFVDQARRSGASWTDIGKSMGVTKQAAQKRFVPRPEAATLNPRQGFGRASRRGPQRRRGRAERRARHRPPEITPDHLLTGLLGDPAVLATMLLHRRQVDTEALRAAVTPAPSGNPAPATSPELIPVSSPARKALELTFREALRLGHNYIGTEHLLLALLELADDGPLHRYGADKNRTEADLINALQAPGGGVQDD